MITDWKQAKAVQEYVLQQASKETQKSPRENMEWYYSQGEIEWHDASMTVWRKQIQAHMQEKRKNRLLDGYVLFMVIWNAQKISEYDLMMWKDLPPGYCTIFVADRCISSVKAMGFRVVKYPEKLEPMPKLTILIRNFILKSHKAVNWKLIVDIRNCILEQIEWNDSYNQLKDAFVNTVLNITTEIGLIQSQKKMAEIQVYINNVSMATDPIDLVFRLEGLLILLLKLVTEIHRRANRS